jgi:hypothetical protein
VRSEENHYRDKATAGTGQDRRVIVGSSSLRSRADRKEGRRSRRRLPALSYSTLLYLIPEHGQTLLEGELEPVPHGNPVSAPVVKILVTDDSQDALEVVVGRGLGVGEHICRVEDVQPLVLPADPNR